MTGNTKGKVTEIKIDKSVLPDPIKIIKICLILSISFFFIGAYLAFVILSIKVGYNLIESLFKGIGLL